MLREENKWIHVKCSIKTNKQKPKRMGKRNKEQVQRMERTTNIININ